ncbi:hypothetical protein BC832DRAFT_468135 [Gaertneriomyces semiglobifer]|nr:hypothetical protein BC832DRAFT_468135 [Gaertneriomyces semiglobifer]
MPAFRICSCSRKQAQGARVKVKKVAVQQNSEIAAAQKASCRPPPGHKSSPRRTENQDLQAAALGFPCQGRTGAELIGWIWGRCCGIGVFFFIFPTLQLAQLVVGKDIPASYFGSLIVVLFAF